MCCLREVSPIRHMDRNNWQCGECCNNAIPTSKIPWTDDCSFRIGSFQVENFWCYYAVELFCSGGLILSYLWRRKSSHSKWTSTSWTLCRMITNFEWLCKRHPNPTPLCRRRKDRESWTKFRRGWWGWRCRTFDSPLASRFWDRRISSKIVSLPLDKSLDKCSWNRNGQQSDWRWTRYPCG